MVASTVTGAGKRRRFSIVRDGNQQQEPMTA
jgi:hypothetical protein